MQVLDPRVPVIVFTRVSAAYTRHPAMLRSAGVHLVYGPQVWPIDEPRHGQPGGRPLPWTVILDRVDQLTGRVDQASDPQAASRST